MSSTSFKVALDWTPNPLHSGLFVAKAQGLYEKAGLDVTLLSPSEDGYATTPGKKLAAGDVDVCLCPSESVVSFQTASPSVPIKACAALLSKDASAIMSRTAKSPKDLPKAGTYASYGARYEDAIVQAMIDADAGGKGKAGTLKTVTPAKLGIYDAVLNGECDSTWIFEAFEGVQAKRLGHNFSTFQLGEYGIPYGYSPLLAYNASKTGQGADILNAFLRATAEGYKYASEHPDEAASILRDAMVAHKLSDRDTDLEFLKESQRAINGSYNLSATGFGHMKSEVWEAFVEFLRANGLLRTRDGRDADVEAKQLYDNSFL